MKFDFETGTFLRISFDNNRDVLSIFKDINDNNEVITYADYFLGSRTLFYDPDINILCNIKTIKNVKPCLDIEIDFLKDQLLEKRMIFKNNKLYKLKYEDYTVVKLAHIVVIYGGENGYYHCIDLNTKEELFNISFDSIQNFAPVTKDELLDILPALEAFPFTCSKIKEKYGLIQKEKPHIKLNAELLKIFEDDLKHQVIAIHENPYNEGDLVVNVENIPVMNAPLGVKLAPIHELDDLDFKDNKLNYHPRDIKNYCIGDVIYVRNAETEEWVKKFFACFDKRSDGTSVIKTTDGKVWNYIK